MPTIQTTNRVKISRVAESTFGITPSNPAFKTLRETSSSLSVNPKTVITNEIRADRQVTDLILTSFEAGGDVGGELAFKVADDDIEQAIQGTWSNNPYIEVVTIDTEISDVSTTTITVSAGGASFKTGMLTLTQGFTTSGNNKTARVASSTGTTIVYPASTYTAEAAQIPVGASVRAIGFEGASADITATTSGGNALTSTALDFTTLGISVGEWLKIGGGSAGQQFATAALNDWVRVSAVAAQRISLDRVPSGWTTDAGTGKTIQVFMGDFVVNGTNKVSNTFERQYLDHSPVSYEYLTGQTIDKMTIDVSAGAIATYSRSYIGSSASVSTSRVAGATDTAAPTNFVLNASSNVGRIGFDGATITGPSYVMSAKIEINNNLRRQMAIGSIGAVGTGNGEFTCTLGLNTYFGDKSILDKIMNNTLTSFDIRLGRQDGNKENYVFDFPSIKLASGSPAVSGKNQDVMINANATAFMHATLGYTVSCGRFWYLP